LRNSAAPQSFFKSYFLFLSHRIIIIFASAVSLGFTAPSGVNVAETREFTGFFIAVTKYQRRYFFVECAKLRVLPFSPVVEKTNAESREILTFRDSGGQRALLLLAG
jgi:hypothetical protein